MEMPEKRRASVGDWIHVIEIAAIFISIGINYQKFIQIAADDIAHTQALARIEHYLSSKDQDYWHRIHQNGDDSQ